MSRDAHNVCALTKGGTVLKKVQFFSAMYHQLGFLFDPELIFQEWPIKTKRKCTHVRRTGSSAGANLSSLEPNKNVRRLVIIPSVGPIRIAAGAVVSVSVLTPSVSCRARTLYTYCHTVVVGRSISLRVVRRIRVRATMRLYWHYSALVLVADLKKKKYYSLLTNKPSTFTTTCRCPCTLARGQSRWIVINTYT